MDLSVRDRLFALLFFHVVLESPKVPLFTVLNALAQTTLDQVDQSYLQVPLEEGPVAHNMLRLDQSPLKVHSILHECAKPLQSYSNGAESEPWKLKHVADALAGGTDSRFLFPDHTRFNRDGFYHLPTRKAQAFLRRAIHSRGLLMCNGLSTAKTKVAKS